MPASAAASAAARASARPEVVELADGGVAGGAHLAVGVGVERADGVGRLPVGLGEHQLAPRPEVAAARAAAQCPLERMAVRVDETRAA